VPGWALATSVAVSFFLGLILGIAVATPSVTQLPQISAAPPVESSPVSDAPVTAEAEVPPQVYEGNGNDVVDLANPIDRGVLVFECTRCSGDITVESDAQYDNQLISFKKAPYSGKRWLGMRGDTTTRLQVTAQGSWKVTVGGLDLARREAGTGPVSGKGDDVLLLGTAPKTVHFTHRGDSNFQVDLMADSLQFPEGVINEIGSYDGTVFFKVDGSEAALVEVAADGAWSMTPQ
jgi:hypothetical protein